MYLNHFGLNEPPFRITPHTDFFFSGANRGATLEALLYAITHDEGIVKVSGEVGSGKTMLCRVLMERLPEQVRTILLSNPALSRDEILYAIAEELDIRAPGDRLSLLLIRLQEHLIALYGENQRVVLLIDEAHAMPQETLEQIRLLSNLESSHSKLLQIVLFGQPELDAHLSMPHMRQLKERITQSFRLEPMPRSDIEAYLDFRMRAAGYRGPKVFSADAVRHIVKASEGLTRRVNILADKSLLAAFADNEHGITARHVKRAIADSEFYRPKASKAKIGLVAGGIAAGVAIGLAASYLLSPAPAPQAAAPATSPAAANTIPAQAAVPMPAVASDASGSPAPAVQTGAAPAPPAPTVPLAGQQTPPAALPPQAQVAPAAAVAAAPAPPSALPSAAPANAATKAAPATQTPAPAKPASAPLVLTPAASAPSDAQKAGALAAPTPAAPPPAASEEKSQSAAQSATATPTPVAPPAGRLTRERFGATQEWLRTAAGEKYSVQLVTTRAQDVRRIEDVLSRAPARGLKLADFYVYSVKINDQQHYRLAYGVYPTMAEADQAMRSLPAVYRQFGLFYRSVERMRSQNRQ